MYLEIAGAVAAVLLVSSALLYGLDWGLPRQSWTDLLLRYEEPAPDFLRVGRMQKDKWLDYAWRVTGANSILGLSSKRASELGVASPGVTVEEYDTLQKYLVSTKGSDEGSTLATIRRMAREGNGFDPLHYRYGGAFLYPLAACLGIGYLGGWVQTSLDENALLQDSTPMRPVYVTGRLLSAASLLAAFIVLSALIARQFHSLRYGLFVLLALGTSPLALNFARSVKPHALTAAWASLALVFLLLHSRSRKTSLFYGSSISAGLTGGGLLTTAPILALPLTYVLLDSKGSARERISAAVRYVVIPAIVTFIAINPFMLTNPRGFFETVGEVAFDNRWGYSFSLSTAAGTEILRSLLLGLGGPLTLSGLIGLVAAARTRSPLARSASMTILLGLLAFSYFPSRPRFIMYLLPCFAFIGCAAIHWSLAMPRRWISKSVIGSVCLALALQFLLAAESLDGLRRERADFVEHQVDTFLLEHEVAGLDGASDTKLRPFSHAPFPLLGVNWSRSLPSSSRPEQSIPDFLIASKRLLPADSDVLNRFLPPAKFGVPRNQIHRSLSFEHDWFKETFLYFGKGSVAAEPQN